MVVACGSIESPALLLRSGIGGPAAGKHLRLHPAFVVMGIYDEPRGLARPGPVGALGPLLRHRGRLRLSDRGHRSLPALLGASYPWESGLQHKQLMQLLRWQAPFITVARDHGSGEVVLDEHDRPLVRWDFTDEVDAGSPCARTWSWPSSTRPPGRADRGVHRPQPRAPLAPGRGLRRLPRRARASPGRSAARRSWSTRWAPAGWAPIPRRRWPTAAASCTT